MINLAKKGTRGRIYYNTQQRYRKKMAECLPKPPASPWKRWAITGAHFRLHNPRDPLEIIAGLKWPIDLLVDEDFLVDDSQRELVEICYPTQEVKRKGRGVTLTLEKR